MLINLRNEETAVPYSWSAGTRLAFTGVSAATPADLPEGVYCLSPTQDCFVTVGSSPVAADAAGSLFIPAGALFHVVLPVDAKIAAVRAATSGSLLILPVA